MNGEAIMIWIASKKCASIFYVHSCILWAKYTRCWFYLYSNWQIKLPHDSWLSQMLTLHSAGRICRLRDACFCVTTVVRVKFYTFHWYVFVNLPSNTPVNVWLLLMFLRLYFIICIPRTQYLDITFFSYNMI